MAKRSAAVAKIAREAARTKTMRVPEYRFPVQSVAVASVAAQPMYYREAAPTSKPVEVVEYDPFAELMAKPRSATPANDLEAAAVGCRVIRYCRTCGRPSCTAPDAWWITRLVPDRMGFVSGGYYGERLSDATMQELDKFYG